MTGKFVRRVVTANNAEGRSYFLEDADITDVRTNEARPGYRITNIWATEGSPVDTAATNAVGLVTGVMPPTRGTVLRMVEFPPEPKDKAERARMVAATFASLYGDMGKDTADGPHPGMHTTPTVDYAIVIEGEMTAVMDEGECVLRPGDVLIQRETRHAWANKSDQICRMLFVLIDGRKNLEGQ